MPFRYYENVKAPDLAPLALKQPFNYPHFPAPTPMNYRQF